MSSESNNHPSNLEGWLTFLESIHPAEIDLTLDRVKTLYRRLELGPIAKQVVLVAGTNGKGTTCAALENIALGMGKSVAVYSSPHVLDYRERVRINQEMLPEEAHCKAFEKVEAIRGNQALTYFEFGTLAALVLIAEQDVDLALLEIGLGGRLDAVNVVEPDLSIITSIDLDHQAWLGDTREKVAYEKAGIIREHGKAVIGELAPPANLIEICQERSVECYIQTRDFKFSDNGQNWSWSSDSNHFTNLPNPAVPTQNVSTALMAAQVLGWNLEPDALQKAIAKTSLPGRFQRLRSDPTVILDVAHNPQATRYLKQKLQAELSGQLHLILGMLSDKDSQASLQPFLGLNARWHIAPLPTERSASVESIKSFLPPQEKVLTFGSVEKAFLSALENADDEDTILVFGSFFTVAEILAVHPAIRKQNS